MADARGAYEALRDAVERRDNDAIAELLADDVELVQYDKRNPPSSPLTLQGRQDVERLLQDIYSRELTHEIHDEVVGDRRFSYNEHCRYPDGNRVVASWTIDAPDGVIRKAVVQQTWDE
jgi:ketosteroid isomerase-like protein